MPPKIDIKLSLETTTAEAKKLFETMEMEGLECPKGDYDEILGEAHTTLAQIDAVKEFQTRPMKNAYDDAVKPYNDAIRLWKKVKDLAKDLIGQHTLGENQRDALALETAAEAEDTEAIAQTSTVVRDLKHASAKGRWTFRVLDAKLVPDRFCIKTVNLHLVENAIDEGSREIPGIEIYPKVDVRVSNRKKET